MRSFHMIFWLLVRVEKYLYRLFFQLHVPLPFPYFIPIVQIAACVSSNPKTGFLHGFAWSQNQIEHPRLQYLRAGTSSPSLKTNLILTSSKCHAMENPKLPKTNPAKRVMDTDQSESSLTQNFRIPFVPHQTLIL